MKIWPKLSSLIRHTIQSSNVWIYWSNEKSQMVLGKMGWPKLSWAMLDVPHWSNGTSLPIPQDLWCPKWSWAMLDVPHWFNGTSQVVHGKFQIVLSKMGWPNETSLPFPQVLWCPKWSWSIFDVPQWSNGTSQLVQWDVPNCLGQGGKSHSVHWGVSTATCSAQQLEWAIADSSH